MGQAIIQFISDYFEPIMLSVFLIAGCFVVTLVAAWMKGFPYRRFFSAVIRNGLVGIFVLILIAIAGILGLTYWYQIHHPYTQSSYSEDILARPYWIKDQFTVYFTNAQMFGSVNLNGDDFTELFSAPDNIQSYHLSPNGEYVLVKTLSELYLLNLSTSAVDLVDSVAVSESEAARGTSFKGSVSGVRWAPSSRRFLYSVWRASPAGQTEHHFVYEMDRWSKRKIQGIVVKNKPFYWDAQGMNVYYFRMVTSTVAPETSAYDCLVHQISLSTLRPEFFEKYAVKVKDIPFEQMQWSGVQLFSDADDLSVGRALDKDVWQSSDGQIIGIDEDDYLYLVKKPWAKKRLLKMTREPEEGSAHYAHGGGDHTLKNIRWLPGGRYVLMEDRRMGGFILDTQNGKMGQLAGYNADNFGWYTP